MRRDELLKSSFDFSIRLIELVKYLKDEGKEFPFSEFLFECGAGIWVNLRLMPMAGPKERTMRSGKALELAIESECILELLAKTGYLTEKQSGPIRGDCARLIEGIADMKKENNRSKAGDQV